MAKGAEQVVDCDSHAPERSPLSEDRWTTGNEPEFMEVRSQFVADLLRSTSAIKAVGRILHNSLAGPNGGNEIDQWHQQNLAGAIECLSDFMYERLEEMNARADRLRRGHA